MNTQLKKKRGRPAIANPATEQFPSIRVTKEKLAEYRQAAETEGLKFAEWVRGALDKSLKVKERKASTGNKGQS